VRTRTAAEVCRSALAFWNTPTPYDAIGPEVVPELSGVLMSLDLLKMLDRKRSEASLEEFKRAISPSSASSNQIAYFLDHAAQSAAEAREYRVTIWACVGLAVAANVWLFATSNI
jgi:hypothetical protein